MKNFGLLPTKIGLEHWLFSAGRGLNILQDDCQWDDFLPSEEIQNSFGFDPCSCTVYGTINAIEILFKKLGIDVEYSERFISIAANVKCPGADPHSIAEKIREIGLIDEVLLPWDSAKTYDEYYAPKPLPEELYIKGREWLAKAQFNHWWAFKPDDSIATKVHKIKQALQYSPVCVSVFAWVFQNGIAVKPPNSTDGHWCVIYGWNEDGTWKCFDSLDYSKKTLATDYNFTYGKMFSITPIKVSTGRKGIFAVFIDIIKKLCKLS